MTQAVLGPAIILIVDLLPEKNWLPVLAPQEESIALCWDSQTIELPLDSCIGNEVVILNLEN
jgi:hypothetical protein